MLAMGAVARQQCRCSSLLTPTKHSCCCIVHLHTSSEMKLVVLKLPELCNCKVLFCTTATSDCKTAVSASAVTVKLLLLLLGTTSTLIGAQTWMVEHGSTCTTAMGRAAAGEATGAAAVGGASGKLICAPAGVNTSKAAHSNTAKECCQLMLSDFFTSGAVALVYRSWLAIDHV